MDTALKYLPVFGPLLLTFVWLAWFFHRSWRGVRKQAMNSLELIDRLSTDLSKLPWIGGQVTAAKVDAFEYRTSGDSSAGQAPMLYRPALRYTYEVDGREFSGSSATLEMASPERDYAERIVKRYSPGTLIRVHFRPEDPAISYLDIEEFEQTLESMRELVDASIASG